MWIEERNGKFKFIERYTDYLTGKQKRVSITFEKNTAQIRKQAQRALNNMINEKYSQIDTKDITLFELIESYRLDQKRTVKESTYKRNYFACDTLMKILGKDTLVNRLNAQIIRERFLMTDKSNGTLNEHLTRLKALLRWGYRNDLVDNISFLDKIEPFKDKPHKEKIQNKFLEASELKTLLDGMQIPIWRALTEFLVLSGLRCGEALALTENDIDFDNRIIHVNKTYDSNNDVTTTPKTFCSIREVYMQDDLYRCCKLIKLLMLEQKLANGISLTNNLFIFDKNGNHLHYFAYNKYLKSTSKRLLDHEITVHTLRHTHASLLMEKGIDIEVISRRLGHENSKITKEIYLHVTEQLKQKDNEILAKVSFL